MFFEQKPYEWNKVGAEPTTSEKNLGLQGGMGLPASFLNEQWRRTYLCIKEIQEKLKEGTNENLIVTNSLVVGPTANQLWLGACSSALGYELYHADYLTSVGKFSKSPAEASLTSNVGDLFIVGSGIQGGARSNAFRVTAAGDVMGTKAYATSGADYAEMFEFEDGNPYEEDRRGMFVTLEGEKIRPASEGDYILGVISAMPSVIGDAHTEDWQGKYETDVFGARILENGTYKLSEDFEMEKDNNYTSRLERPEWATVGLLGKLVVIDDGTCKVNGYCMPDNGIATHSKTGYRVIARIDETHVKIVLK